MRREEMKTKAASEIQNSAINVLKARVEDAATEFREARSQYQKENSKSGERRMNPKEVPNLVPG